MGQWFTLPTSRKPIDCFSFGPYYPYRVRGEMNAKFDRYSGAILTSKSSEKSNFGQVVRHFADQLASEIQKWPLERRLPAGTDFRMMQGRPLAKVVLVPSSKANKVSDGLTQIMEKVCAKERRLQLASGALVRVREIDKLATGGNRCVSVHMKTIALKKSIDLSGLVILVDDVCTSGNSLIACCEIIQNQTPETNVIGIVLGKTSHE